MPIYEYECNACHEITEALQKFSDEPLDKCPHCGGPMHKMMSLNAFHLKGQGWYTTDYAGKNSSTLKTGESTAAPAESKCKESCGDSPAPKCGGTCCAASSE